ncbi:NlpC/P60 family protein [Murinocardiopsis flavida]|uniref:NlpC/P60 family protein n=1 Tax=Murinocardiopsis flavida TaxID=645275 RepID=A0A2P8DQP0_9ACTN|nr:C40 family peptidase [Murinocardiopsis flavida]PSK99528.1 NlpC/P60 family protein [Murinocardiopsis flavida]
MCAALSVAGLGGAAPAAAAQAKATKAVDFAKAQLGKPYRYGGNGPSSYDCSGLVKRSYRSAGVSLSRTTQAQYRQGRSVARSHLRPGDLVFFYRGPSHVGMYVGGGKMVHAPSSGKRIKVERMAGHYNGSMVGARRVA